MKELDSTPRWVSLAYSSVHTRKMALILVVSCAIFTLYCIPWVHFSKNVILAKFFLVDDWSWFIVMVPMTIWYWLSLRWVDGHDGWE